MKTLNQYCTGFTPNAVQLMKAALIQNIDGVSEKTKIRSTPNTDFIEIRRVIEEPENRSNRNFLSNLWRRGEAYVAEVQDVIAAHEYAVSTGEHDYFLACAYDPDEDVLYVLEDTAYVS